jgi:hypothetical protein
MRAEMRIGMLAALMLAELAVCGSVWAQKTAPPTTMTSGAVGGIDIIVRKKPGAQNMACMSNGKPCNQDQVRQLAAAASKKGITLSLAGPDGALQCTTKPGPCTDDHVAQVQTAAKEANSRAVSTKGVSGAKLPTPSPQTPY